MRVSILQWNVWFKEDIRKVLDLLQEHNTDIICLQELTRGYIDQTEENTWDYLAHELGYEYHYKDMPIITGDEEWFQGNATFSRFPIEHRHSDWINEPVSDSGRDDQYRVYLETEIVVDAKILRVANTHMSYTLGFSDSEKSRQKAEIKRLMELIGEGKTKYILCADLNTAPDSPIIKELQKKLKNAGPAFDQKTWTTKAFRYGDFIADKLDWRLDYILVSPDVKVNSAEIVKTDVSDHLPIKIEIEV